MENPKIAPPPETTLHFLDYWRIIRIRKTVILAVFLLVVITATVVTYILPVSYASSVRIKIEGEVSDINPLTERQPRSGYDPYMLQTEFEVIQSQAVLPKVIENLDLNTKWAKRYNAEGLKPSDCMAILKRRLDVRQFRNTSLMEVRVFSEDPREAAVIANEIAEVYRKYRTDERQKLAEGGIKALRKQWDDQNDKVKKAQEEVDGLRKDLKISDTDAAGNGPSYTLEPMILQRDQVALSEAETKYIGVASLMTKLMQLDKLKLRQTLPTAMQDLALNDLLSRLNMAEQQLVTQNKDYGPESTEIKRTTALVEKLNTQIDDRVEGILEGLKVQLAKQKAEVDSLSAKVENAKKTDIEVAERSRPYFQAKRLLESEMKFREMLNYKIGLETTDALLPKTSMVSIVDKAEPALRPVKPNKPLNIILGIIVGLLVGVGLAFFIEYLDTSVKTIDEVERSLQAPVLGVIPQNVGYIINEGAESPHAEAYRVLRTNLLFARKDDKLTAIVVVSAGAGEGKSTTVFNLATVFAQNGQHVLLVDSDLRRPTLHKILGLSNSAGLTNYLLKQNTLEEVIQTTSIPTLDFLPSGKLPSSSMGILNSKQMEDLVREVKQRYDFIFFDSPPMMGLSDAAILASEMDLAIQVVQYRRYPQPMTIRAKQMVEKVGGNLIGIVLNNINMSQDENYYYYSGYYSDYYSKNEETEVDAKSTPGKKAQLELKQKY
ncbi:MAG: polysaccharide biosynthesis tyrosine autokinase [Verrucomicrobia bacterium]|nr:polysaccharide biosynthesis tyrosine autokinase [Verrucomicrobiota bacterium]